MVAFHKYNMKKGDGNNSKDSKICFLGNFPPRACGIATFTQDLVVSMNKKFNPVLKSKVIALNEDSDFYNYDNRVLMQLNKDDPKEYKFTAEKVNKANDVKLISIQHEFGIFGGEYGDYLLKFLEKNKKPVAITFHSVLPNPDKERKEVVKAIASNSNALIVMAEAAVDILNKDYNISRSKIHIVHHGIPNVPLSSSEPFKKKLKLENRKIISTFGLLSKGKGIEYMIKSLPELVKKHPDILYLIIGETHPVVRRNEGERYRNKLIKLVKDLGLNNNVKFHNKFISLEELTQYLQATDIYVCTNLERNQIVSGTLSYAMGCGRSVVSTPIIYAEEILADGRGMLAKFKNPKSYAKAIDKLLSDDSLREEMERQAYAYTRSMIWSNVASRYLNVFNKVVELREETTKKYPAINLKHLINLTDNFGCIQFSKEDTSPDISSGYTLDDNARALIATVLHNSILNSPKSEKLTETYLKFLENSQEKDGDFKNHFKNKEEKQDSHSEDAFGRAVWALGYTISKSKNSDIIKRSEKMLKKSLPKIKELENIRAKAFSINGLYNYYQKNKNRLILSTIKKLANSLVEEYNENSSPDWEWYEEKLTYSNSKLPEALFLAYRVTKDKKYLEVAEKTLNFLSDIVFIDDELLPVGQAGWFEKGGKRALYDQQPIDAATMVQTCITAYKTTKDEHYYEKAVLAFNWFLGRNNLKQMVYNESTGGCFDGLTKSNLNLNQGAESTISYLLARLRLEEIKRKKH
jgi:glycosyltransferase involved in cell wall biosynthesis